MNASLEADLDVRGQVPDHPSILERWTASSALARAELECRCDIAYGDHALEKLDVFPAKASEGLPPILVFIHGGYWQRLDKSDFSFLARPWVEAGVTFVALNYPLAPQADMDAIAASAQAGLQWVIDHAAELGGDAGQVFLCGHSAGAHLAALAATRLDKVQGWCGISGIYDLEPVRHVAANAVVKLDQPMAARNSPVLLAPRTPGLPVILAVGDGESAEFKRQQQVLAEAWGVGRSLVLDHTHHFSSCDCLGNADHGLFGLMLDMIDGR